MSPRAARPDRGRLRASFALLALLAGSCRPAGPVPPPAFAGAGNATPHRGGTLRFTITDDVRNLDPAIGFDEYSMYALHLLFDTLLDYESALSRDPLALRPSLAESWTVSEDGLVYTFKIRQGVRYSDGARVEVGDFVYALDRLLSPDLPSPGAQFYLGIAGAEERIAGKSTHISGVTARDDRTLEVRLSKRDASFPLLCAMPFTTPLRKDHVERVGARMRDTPLGTGPFRLAAWKEGESMRFERNPHYWRPDLPYLDAIEMGLQVHEEVAALRFLKGESDTVERLSSDDYLRFAESAAWQPYIYRAPQMNSYGELLNVQVKPLDDRRVRQALNYAVNKEDTIRLYNDRAVISHGILPPGMLGYDPDMQPYPYDPDKARRLLAEAGYPDGFELTYVTLQNDLSIKVAQSIQADLARVGVKVKIQILTFPAYLTATGRREVVFGYTAWLMDFPDPWDFLEVKFHSRMIADENANNDTGYSNPEVDRLLDEARGELDRTKRAALYHRVEEILFVDCPWIWHYHRLIVEVREPYVMNYAPHPVWIRDYREAWLDEPRRRVN